MATLPLGRSGVWEAAGGSGEQREGRGERVRAGQAVSMSPETGFARAQEDGHSRQGSSLRLSHKHRAHPRCQLQTNAGPKENHQITSWTQ